MTEPLSPATGWGVVHLFVQRGEGNVDAGAVLAACADLEADGHQVVGASILGHKADACFMALGPDWVRLRRFQGALQRAGLRVVDSYVSLTEVSEYAKGVPEEMKQARLYPKLPPEGKRAFCFYPMSKRRGDAHNWFTLPYDEREALMRGHGASGRAFAGRVLQVVTGSTGIDDFEWGVTLFAVRPDDLKDVVYTMRFDEASANYGEFGRFYSGVVTPVEELLELLS